MRERGANDIQQSVTAGWVQYSTTQRKIDGLWIGWPSLLSLYAFVIISLSSLQSLPNNIISPSTSATFNTCRLFPTVGLKWHIRSDNIIPPTPQYKTATIQLRNDNGLPTPLQYHLSLSPTLSLFSATISHLPAKLQCEYRTR